MRSKEIRQSAQDAIMHAAMTCFVALDDEGADQNVVDEARKQINRIEKLFGFEIGSWRG